MSEGYIENRREIGVEAAWVARDAFEQQAQAEDLLSHLGAVNHIEGVVIQGEVLEQAQKAETDASRDYQDYSNVVGLMIGYDAPTRESSPAIEVEPIEVPDIDAETFQKLETLSPEFRQRVTTRYVEAYRATEGYIREGKLPESYRMPELKGLMDRIEAVAPAFEALLDKAWSPSVEFVPEGLTSAEWNDLFAGHKLPNGEQMVGNYRTIPEGTIDTIGRDSENQSRWDVAVISTSDRPIYTQVSKDGKHGSNAKEAVEVFAALPWVTATAKKPADVIAQVSPREAVYNRLQLARLERGEQPVDSQTWTISQENVKVVGQVRSVFQNFDPNYRQVYSTWNYLDNPFDRSGVRPSASGSDLVFKSVTSS